MALHTLSHLPNTVQRYFLTALHSLGEHLPTGMAPPSHTQSWIQPGCAIIFAGVGGIRVGLKSR